MDDLEHYMEATNRLRQRAEKAEAEVERQRRHRKWALEGFRHWMRKCRDFERFYREENNRAQKAEADDHRLTEERDKLQERVRELEEVFSWKHKKGKVNSLGECTQECYCSTCGYLRKHK